MMLELNWTKYLNHFKQLIGQSNHFLITILIGLEGVRTGIVEKGETFNVSWYPISIEDSVRRSRIYARNAALSWTIDSLDAYIGFLKKHPFSFPEPFKTNLQNEKFIYKSLNQIIEFVGYETDLPLCLVHLGIQWRNNLVHYHADNELDHEFATYIRNIDKKNIQERFRGLDPELMLENFNDRNNPTFKEVAAIIQSTHYLVLELDRKLKEFIDIDIHIDHIIREKENEIDVKNIITSAPEKRFRKMKRFLITKGFKEVTETDSKTKFEDKQIEKIIENLRTIFYISNSSESD